MQNTINEEQQLVDEIESLEFQDETDESSINDDALREIGAIESEFYAPDIEASIKHTVNEWKKHTNINPEISGNDIDAYWQGADFDGSETSGGSAPTPDQNIVDENAKPWGIVYSPYEELDINKKIKELEKKRIESEGWDDRI